MKHVVIVIFVSLLGACSSTSIKSPYGASGVVWCNDPFLRDIEKPFGPVHRNVAKKGYIYALAGALVLQGDSAEDNEHFFPTPSRLRKVDQPQRHQSGFEVATYELYDEGSNELKEVIIAFTGSNDRDDWVLANLLFSKEQYNLARAYTKNIATKEAYKNIPLVLTGYSLGGGLAVHVAKSNETSSLVSRVWAFNPSPKIYAKGNTDERIWLAAARGEALKKLRSPGWRFWPGVSNIGAPSDQTAENFYLIRSNPIYGHFRWVLARNMLHVADLALYLDGENGETEPLKILRASHFSACQNSNASLNKSSKKDAASGASS